MPDRNDRRSPTRVPAPPTELDERQAEHVRSFVEGREAPSSNPPATPQTPDPASAPPQRKRQDSTLDRVEVHARWWSAMKSIAVGVGFVLSILGAAATWGINHWIIEPKMQELKDQLDPLVLRPSAAELKRLRDEDKKAPPSLEDRFAEVRADIADVRRKLDAPNDPKSDLGKKLDALDKTIQERLPARPNKTSVPPVGPTATQQGRQ